jgi:hypothetical protein
MDMGLTQDQLRALVMLYLYPGQHQLGPGQKKALFALGLIEGYWTGGKLRENRYVERPSPYGREVAERELARRLALQGWSWDPNLAPGQRELAKLWDATRYKL